MKKLYIYRGLTVFLMLIYGIFAVAEIHFMLHKESTIGFIISLIALTFILSTIRIFDRWSKLESDLKIELYIKEKYN